MREVSGQGPSQPSRAKKIQCDEIWSYVAAKQKNVTPAMAKKICGDVWTWSSHRRGQQAKSCSWMIGRRDADTARDFIQDLSGRLRNRIQLTTDGLKVYVNAVLDAFGTEIDYAILHKVYGARYSPAKCIGTEQLRVLSGPDPRYISTSYIERSNLTMRMHMRRFTRLTNAFSKKVENHIASVAIHCMYYNFVRIHQTLRVTPAMQAGLTNRLWAIEDLIALLG